MPVFLCFLFLLTSYVENLSIHRSVFECEELQNRESLPKPKKRHTSIMVPFLFDRTTEISELFQKIKSLYSQITIVDGYTIQVYNGSVRDLAFAIKNLLELNFMLINSEIACYAPNYKVTLGNFIDKAEVCNVICALLNSDLKNYQIKPIVVSKNIPIERFITNKTDS